MDPRATPTPDFSTPIEKPFDPFRPMGVASDVTISTVPITIPSTMRPIVNEGFEDSPPPIAAPSEVSPGRSTLTAFRTRRR